MTAGRLTESAAPPALIRRIAALAVASYSALPEPMLARSGRLPTRGGWAYGVKWDGFPTIASAERRCACVSHLRCRESRRA
jgi:hypothetical protein